MIQNIRTYLILGLVVVYSQIIYAQDVTKTNSAYNPGEKLKYRAHYGWVTGGYAHLEVATKKEDINGRQCHQLTLSGYSVGFTDWVFKVKDKYISYIDDSTLLPVKHIRDIKEGNYKSYNAVIFDRDSNLAISEKSGKHKVPVGIHDIVSSFYYLRNTDFGNAKKGDTIVVQTFFDDNLFPLAIKHAGIEKVKTELGTFKCIKFNPMVQKGRIFKSQDELSIWVTNDGNFIPILIQSELLVGSLKFELVEYEGVKHDLLRVY